MFSKRRVLIIVILIGSLAVYSQESVEEAIEIKKNAISFNIAGSSPVLGITYEKVISNKLSLEFGVGIPSISAGIRFFPFDIKEQKALFNLGLTAMYLNSGDNEIIGFEGSLTYFPIGLSYFGRKGFNFAIDIGPAIVRERYSTDLIPYGGIRFGKRF